MQTTCPECRTTYRIAQTQLSLRRGLVRCGHCNTVFNAYDSLLPDLNAEPTPAPVPRTPARVLPRNYASDQEPASLTEVVRPASEVPADDAPPLPLVSAPADNPDDALPGEESAADKPDSPDIRAARGLAEPPETQADLSPATDPALMQAAEETSDSILLSELPTARQEDSPRARAWLTALYALLTLLLLALLSLQVIGFLRAEIAQTWPAARPALNRACAAIGCTVALPRTLGKDAIISSSLEHDAENKSRVRLTLLLANRTGQAQAWPDVVLTLTDVRDSPVGQTPFKPNAYLPKGVHPAAGMPPESEWEIRLDLEIGNLDASGYALDLLYP
ncbi:MAG: zinc-ribbon domain-containing protein [Betaproteobacteria bacterium]|nr:zinc-ribbon domain-containing protein [Betaproteobacteria bacterium]